MPINIFTAREFIFSSDAGAQNVLNVGKRMSLSVSL